MCKRASTRCLSVCRVCSERRLHDANDDTFAIFKCTSLLKYHMYRMFSAPAKSAGRCALNQGLRSPASSCQCPTSNTHCRWKLCMNHMFNAPAKPAGWRVLRQAPLIHTSCQHQCLTCSTALPSRHVTACQLIIARGSHLTWPGQGSSRSNSASGCDYGMHADECHGPSSSCSRAEPQFSLHNQCHRRDSCALTMHCSQQ